MAVAVSVAVAVAVSVGVGVSVAVAVAVVVGVGVCVGAGVAVRVGVRVGVGVGGQAGPSMLPYMEPAPTLMPKVTLVIAKFWFSVTENCPLTNPSGMLFHLTPVRPVWPGSLRVRNEGSGSEST